MGDGIRVNFHCHSTFSDGALSPERLAEVLAGAGCRWAALTDHDTVAGLARFEQALAARGIGCLPGAEITADDADAPLHLLAYGFDPENPHLRDLFRSNGERTGQPSAAEAIAIVHRAGGTAFLAHPMLGMADIDQLDRRLGQLKAAGLDGIETVYSQYPDATRQQLAQLARRHGLLASAGSDFHGFGQPGLDQATVEMPAEAWTAFRAAHKLPDAVPHPARPGRDAPVPRTARRRILKAHAPAHSWKRFTLRILFPPLLAVGLFVATIFAMIIPTFERHLLDRKREVIRELTNSAWSIVAEQEKDARAGLIGIEEAQRRASERIQSLRYGQEQKDYFWITDIHPRMVMHPYRADLNGADLNAFADVRGRKLFVELARMARERGEGYVEYYWQWKDNPDRVAPKQSFIRHFEPWGWVIGTGIYLDDVNREIAALSGKLMAFCLGITGLMVFLLAFMTRESLLIERRRADAEAELRESHEKYAALVEASTEGTLMVLEGRCAYCSRAMAEMLGYTEQELLSLDVGAIFPPEQVGETSPRSVLAAMMEGGPAPGPFEAEMVRKDGERIEVVLAVTRLAFAGKTGFILLANPRTLDLPGSPASRRRSEAERQTLLAELQTALLFLNEPLRNCIRPMTSCDMQTPVRQAALLMTRHGCNALAITAGAGAEVIGLLTDHDLRERVVACGGDMGQPAFAVMSAPVFALPDAAPVYEAILQMQQRGIHHVAIRNAEGRVVSIVRNTDLIQFHQYSSAVITSEIQRAQSIEQIVEVRARLPQMVRTLLESGAKPRNILRITTRLGDAIVERLLESAMKELGPAPCRFCFVALGSEGRGEQTLATDQDNAIIYEDLPPEAAPAAAAYFNRLGERICDALHQVGYVLCRGEIMARNPRWCQPLTRWKQHFAGWITGATPQDLLEFNIFFDFRGVSGDTRLTEELRQFIHQVMEENPPFLLHFAQNALLYKPPIGLFGQLLVDSGGQSPNTLNIKEAALPIVNFARLYALRERLEETNTTDRLHRLVERQVIREGLGEEAAQAYECLLRMRLEHQARLLADGRPADNSIDPKGLNQLEETLLRQAFSVVSTIRKKISYDFLGMA